MPGGRPSKLTPELQKRFLGIIRKGNYRVTACHSVDVTTECLSEWLRRGALGDEPYAEFSDALRKAEAYAERALLSQIRRGADAWQSRAWMLERKAPARWSGRVKATVYDEMQGLVAKLKERLDPETWMKVLRVITDAEEDGDAGAPVTPVAGETKLPEHRGTA